MKYRQCIGWIYPYILTVNIHFHSNKIQIHDSASYPVCSHFNINLTHRCVSEKLSIQNTVMSCILQFLFSLNKTLYFWPSVTLPNWVVPLGIWYATFRDNLVVSYPWVEILRNISVHEDVCASLFRNLDNQLTSDKESYLRSKVTECSWSRPGCNWHIHFLIQTNPVNIPFVSLEIPFFTIFPSTPRSSKWYFSDKSSHHNTVYTSRPYVPHATPITFFLILSSEYCLVKSTDHAASHFT